MLFDFCVRRDCGVCVLTARLDGCVMPIHLSWAASKWVSVPFESASPDRLKEARRVPQLIHGVCRERQRCFLDRAGLLANCFTKTSQPSGSRYCISLWTHEDVWRVLKANNRSASQMLFESSYSSVIQPRNVLFLNPLPGSLQV